MKTPNFKINSKHFLYSGLVIAFCILCSGLLILLRSGYFTEKEKPMLSEDVDFLCEELGIKNNTICFSDQEVYPKDFSDLIEEKFEVDSTSYEDVQSIFSQFQIKLDDDGESPVIFLSYYDINRDGVSDLIFYFDGTLEDNVIRFIVFKESF